MPTVWGNAMPDTVPKPGMRRARRTLNRVTARSTATVLAADSLRHSRTRASEAIPSSRPVQDMIPPAGRWRRPQVQAGVQQCRGRRLSEHDLGRGCAHGRRVRRYYWNWLTTEVRRDLVQYKIREPFYPYNTSFSSEGVWRGACASRRCDRRLRLLQALVMWATGAIFPGRMVAASLPLTICPFGHMLFP